MNSILMIVIAVVILLLVFVMFSLDDHEEEMDFIEESETEKSVEAEKKSSATTVAGVNKAKELRNVEKIEQKVKPANVKLNAKNITGLANEPDEIEFIESGTEEDLKLHVMLKQGLPGVTFTDKKEAAVVAVQIRIPESLYNNTDKFTKLLLESEEIFKKEFSFPSSAYHGMHLYKYFIFSKDENRDDYLFEALVTAFEIIARFKKKLNKNDNLRESKVKIAVGISKGDLLRINRGMLSMPDWSGKSVYLAETLAEAAGDLAIYADETVYKSALPLFDFREWKPIKLRSPLSPIALYEMVGWNTLQEIADYASNESASIRKAVAIAYRYLELDNNVQPLIELLSDTNASVALEALKTVKIIGNTQVFSFLKKIFLEAREPVFRSAMIDAFAGIGNPEIVPAILGSTKEKSWQVRLSAVKALYALSKSEALRHIEPLLSDEDAAVKAAANGVFAKETGQPVYLKVLEEILNEPSARGVKSAVTELLEIDSEASLKIIAKYFETFDMEVKKYILGKLEFSNCKALYKCFLTIFEKSNEVSRAYVAEAILRAEMVK